MSAEAPPPPAERRRGSFGPGPAGARPPAPWGVGEAFACVIVGVAATVLVGGLALAATANLSCGAQNFIGGLAGEAAFGATVVLWLRFVSKAPLAALGAPTEPMKDIGTGVVAGVGLIVAGYLVLEIAYLIGTQILGHRPAEPQQVAGCVSGFWLVLTGPVVIVLAPLAEEALFRGFFYQGLRGRMSVWPAALISGGVFGLIHGYPVLIPALAVVGVGLALVYERRQSLLASVAAHAIFNLFGFLLIALAR